MVRRAFDIIDLFAAVATDTRVGGRTSGIMSLAEAIFLSPCSLNALSDFICILEVFTCAAIVLLQCLSGTTVMGRRRLPCLSGYLPNNIKINKIL